MTYVVVLFSVDPFIEQEGNRDEKIYIRNHEQASKHNHTNDIIAAHCLSLAKGIRGYR